MYCRPIPAAYPAKKTRPVGKAPARSQGTHEITENGTMRMKSSKRTITAPAASGRTKSKTSPRRSLGIKPSSPRSEPVPALASPNVRFELYAPGAREVSVAGSFNGWRPAETTLQLTATGLWCKELPLNPGRYEYLFVVDGKWLPDPKAQEYIPNPFGGQNSLVEVPSNRK